MARPAEPWRWEERSGWYAWIHGSRRRLASFDEGKRVAIRRLSELVGKAEGASAETPPVGEVIRLYLADLRRRRNEGAVDPQTRDDAKRRLAGFAEMHGDTAADQIRPHHVQSWLDTKTAWGATSRHDGVSTVKSAFRWAVKQGHVERNPLAELEKPKRAARREVIPPPADIDRMFRAIIAPCHSDLFLFMAETGCRPKEARTLEAAWLDRAEGLAVLERHKTRKKTGKPRVIYLTPIAAEIAFRLADLNPVGPIFRNTKGNPWTRSAVVQAMESFKIRAGVGDEMVTYALRHAYATEALARKVPAAHVAELMGHSDLRMMKNYSHLSEKTESLKQAARAARPDGQAPSSSS